MTFEKAALASGGPPVENFLLTPTYRL